MAASPDENRWLEELTGPRVMNWVRARNAETFAELGGEHLTGVQAGILEALDADDRIPEPHRHGAHLYNLWRDADHPRGLWRRTTLPSYRSSQTIWDVLLDVDALAATEEENWVWHSATILRPGCQRALVQLSRGGSDATVVRELDLAGREPRFVADGFSLPEAKNHVEWIDLDHIYLATDLGPGSLTDAGLPRIVKRWRRGTPLEQAETVFEAEPHDVMAVAVHDHTPGFDRSFVVRVPEQFRAEQFLVLPDGRLHLIDAPPDAGVSVHRSWLLIQLRSPWTIGDVTHPAGALLSAPFEAFLAGDRHLTTLFEPDGHRWLTSYTWTHDHLLMGVLADVRSELTVLTPGDETWTRNPLSGVPPLGEARVVSTDPDEGDEYFLDMQSFLQPPTLCRGVAGGGVELLRRAPARFDASRLTVQQHCATSDDGTAVPYFVVGPREASSAQTGPTLLTGYGGFEVSLTPRYNPIVGRGWLAPGGTYVVANIRGGGEFGPAWHQAALGEHRHRAFEDFAAVASDLAARGIATPASLGIVGASNGGLLVGAMVTGWPDLFGAAVCQVPVLDLERFHKLSSGPAWLAEYGDPDDPADLAHLAAYSPYRQVEAGRCYPPVLFISSTSDDRVHPGHARKMMARMAALGYDVRYFENTEGGHAAAANNLQAATMWALTFEFLRRRLA